MSEENLLEGRICDICGSSDYLAGVASSSLGPMSQLYCHICLSMRAEPEWMIDFIFEEKNFRAQAGKENFCFFDKKLDSYINYGTREVIPVKMKDGTEFLTRKESVEYVKEKDKRSK